MTEGVCPEGLHNRGVEIGPTPKVANPEVVLGLLMDETPDEAGRRFSVGDWHLPGGHSMVFSGLLSTGSSAP